MKLHLNVKDGAKFATLNAMPFRPFPLTWWGGLRDPLRFFAYDGKTSARSAAKFCIAFLTSISHIV